MLMTEVEQFKIITKKFFLKKKRKKKKLNDAIVIHWESR